MFATAADLIAVDDIDDVLARIVARAAVEVRAPRYLLAVRLEREVGVHIHQRGFADAEAEAHCQQILGPSSAAVPDNWIVVPVRSSRREYGRLLAINGERQAFLPQERELLEVYARYAASALDSASALKEANVRYTESKALLELARELAAAGTTEEVVLRLADAVPTVVDCDRVGVYLWNPLSAELREGAVSHGRRHPGAEEWVAKPSTDGSLARLLKQPSPDPLVLDRDVADPVLQDLLTRLDGVAALLVPLTGPDSLLGLLAVAVSDDPGRLTPSPDLLDRLSGVAAQATTALQNGRLVDQITHQAQHDDLTGLANRAMVTDALEKAVARARQRSELVTLFYLDIDGFKPVNDEFGHDAGDELLVAVAGRLTDRTRGGDLVARLGGDEFAVLIEAQAAPEATELLARRLAGAFAEPFSLAAQSVDLTVSIGTSVFPTDADDAEQLLRRADEAMFAAKRSRPRGSRGEMCG